MTQLNVGLAGCGRIVRLAHLRALQADPRVQVVAIADPDPGAKAFAAQASPDVSYFSSADAMLSSASVDAVVIAVPTASHRAVASLAFERRLHVYLEKPIAPTVPDGEAIVAAWQRAGTVGRIGFNCRFNRLYLEMRRAIAEGTIGDPVAVRSSLTAVWPNNPTWRLSPSAGGGALLELASHHIDLFRFLFSAEVVDVHSSTWSNRGDDEAGMLQLVLSNGVRAQTLVCYGTVEEDRFEVYGSEGKLAIDRYNSLVVERQPLWASGGIAASVRRLTSELGALRYGLQKRRAPGQEPSFTESLSAFVTSVTGKRDGAPSLTDGLAALKVIELAKRQANGRVA